MTQIELGLSKTARPGKSALYYPHIHFRSRAWMRATLLYYDSVSRIIPAGLDADESSFYRTFIRDPRPFLKDVDALKSNCFLVEDPPEPYVSQIADEFFDFAMKNLVEPKQRAKLVPALSRRKAFYTIHPRKLDENLRRVLIELKLARVKQGDKYGDLDLDPVTGGMYMLFLANRMVGRRNLVSDSSIYQSLMYQPIGTEPVESTKKKGAEFRLATAVLRTTVPVDLESVPIDKLLRLNSDLKKQRTRFQDKINGLAKQMESAKDDDDLQESIEAHQRKIEDELEELETKLRAANFAIGSGLLAFSVPNWVTAGWGLGITHLNPLSAAIGAAAVSAVVVKGIFDKQIARKTHPLNYLLTLKKRLRPKTMAKNIVDLKLMIDDIGEE